MMCIFYTTKLHIQMSRLQIGTTYSICLRFHCRQLQTHGYILMYCVGMASFLLR